MGGVTWTLRVLVVESCSDQAMVVGLPPDCLTIPSSAAIEEDCGLGMNDGGSSHTISPLGPELGLV